MRILILEDDPPLRDVLAEIFKAEGFHVLTAMNGLDGLDKLEPLVPVDVVLLDIRMPIMGGAQFHRELRKRGWTMPVIVVSGAGAHGYAREISAAAALEKPFDPATLVELVFSTIEPHDQGAGGGR